MQILIREDNSLQIYPDASSVLTTGVVTDDVLAAVEVIRTFAGDFKDPAKIAEETMIALAVNAASDEDLALIATAIPFWEEGHQVSAGWLRMFGGNVYKCVQDHKTQSDWTPPETAALWTEHKRTTEGADVQDYIRPTGAHDAYHIGDMMRFEDGYVYRSTIDNNVWPPTEYPQGWERIEA